MVGISVADNGPGHPAGAICQKYSNRSLPLRKGGTGLGLNIVRHIVESHGGTIIARNRTEATGAIFIVRLPVKLS